MLQGSASLDGIRRKRKRGQEELVTRDTEVAHGAGVHRDEGMLPGIPSSRIREARRSKRNRNDVHRGLGGRLRGWFV